MPAAPENWIPAAVAGGLLTVLGAAMMFGHRRTWHRQHTDESLDSSEHAHLSNRYQRRMQTSALVVIVGVMIALGDVLIWQFGPQISAVYWLLVLGLVLWIALLAVADLTSIRTHARTTTARYNAMRRELEAELQRHQSREKGASQQNRDSE